MTITPEQYNAAADRVRTGRARDGDDALCDAWDAQEREAARERRRANPQPERSPSWYDSPVARNMWRGDAREAGE